MSRTYKSMKKTTLVLGLAGPVATAMIDGVDHRHFSAPIVPLAIKEVTSDSDTTGWD
ncbi:hypothetical protein [Streptomyces sp. S.PNR 29]|uniref:hypothetical protein n=1 Tax=Streptomyces sp. S.PNR 29 TaxID=2973805 RepID=UPI0025B277DB|nr:hypothetical protein [Streptomyces sp. S.PNR 29]MDN0194367.1 hypothetical protein [Streptomyces sp. S.PNR 29]